MKNKLLMIIMIEIISLKDKLVNANSRFEAEKYENQIYILEKVCKDAKVNLDDINEIN